MVITTYTLNIGNTQSLNSFDTVTHMAFGDGTSAVSQTQTALTNELLRVLAFDITKDTTDNEYIFKGRIPITKLNSNTINEIGLFDAASSGNMACRIVLDSGLTKTSDEELVFILKIKVNTINN